MKSLGSSEFLSLVWPQKLLTNEMLELRYIDRRSGKTHRNFFTSIDSFLEEANNHKESEVYFAVSTRLGTDGKKSGCYRVKAIWCDFDKKKIADLSDLSLQPHILVNSGGGVHAYWLLKKPVLVRPEERWNLVENRTRWVAQEFGGDGNTCDIARILRVPNKFYNHKYKPHREVKAFLVGDLDFLYNLDDFGEIEKPEGTESYEILPGRVIDDLPASLKNRLSESGGGRFNDASREDSSNITALLKLGLSPQDTYATFTDSKRGEDAQERKTGHYNDYLQRTIRKSLTFLGKSLTDFKPKTHSNGNGNGINAFANTIKVNFATERTITEQTHEGIHTVRADKVHTQRTRWLWENYIPAEKITLLAGDPGKGKSTIALDLVSRISRGHLMPSGERTVVGNCLIASAEDAPEDTITPRLIAAGANLKRVSVLRQVQIDGEHHFFSLPRDIERLRELTKETGARFIVIDPLNAFLAQHTDSHKDQDIRSVLHPLEMLAEEMSAAVLIVAHLNKKEESSLLHRVGGSIGLTGAARSVLAVADTPKGNIKAFFSIKSNVGKRPPVLAYDTRQVTKTRESDEDWKGEDTIVSSKIKWRGEIDFDPARGSAAPAQKAENEAEDFLRKVLEEGETPAEEVFKEARRIGISRNSLTSIKTQMGVALKKGRDGTWYWSLSDGL